MYLPLLGGTTSLRSRPKSRQHAHRSPHSRTRLCIDYIRFSPVTEISAAHAEEPKAHGGLATHAFDFELLV
jgi:hypothetical protein